MISFGLDEDQRMIQETVRKLAAEHLRPRMREFEKARGVPDSLRRMFHELGLGLLDVPESLGGQGASAVTGVVVHEELAFGDPGAAVALCEPYAAVRAVLALADAAQAERLLAPFAASDGHARSGALAFCERGAPLEGFSTVARRQADGYVLDGKKAFVVGGGTADLTIVFAQLAGTRGWGGVAAFAIEGKTAGLRAGARHDLLGLETVRASELTLEGCVVPATNRLLGGGTADSFAAATSSLLRRLALVNAARQVGLAHAAYEIALEYTQERRAFGKPVAHFQSIAFSLADMLMDVEAARCMVWRAASDLDRGSEAFIAEAVVHANEAAWRVADLGVQLLGGAGYIQDFPVEKWLRDTKALGLFGLPSEGMQLAAAAHQLGVTEAGLPSSALQPFFT